ncbi:MAG TPA: hypothetical protein VGK67_01040 [Myxococcales bacterium]|jgi:hypothetical protein
MSRSLVLATCFAALAALAGCSEPATGHCTGTLAGKSFDADIDPESEHHTVQRQVCTQSRNKTRWAFSYGEGALRINALSGETTNSSVAKQELFLPPPFDGSSFEEWSVVAPIRSEMVPGGTMTVPSNFDLSDNVFGTFRMGLADGSQLECTFSLPKGNDEGADIDCPDEHHSDDDWD